MSENNNDNKGKTTLSLGGKKLGLSSSSTVKQNLSRGRSKTVTVEVKKSKFSISKDHKTEQDFSGLTDKEREARLAAVRQAEENKDVTTQTVSQNKIEVKQSLTEKLENIEKQAAAPAPSAQPNYQGTEKPGEKKERPQMVLSTKSIIDDEVDNKKKPGKSKFSDDKRDRSKLTITQALAFDSEEKVRSFSSMQRARMKKLKQQQQNNGEPAFKAKEIIIPELISVQELANRMAVRAADVIKELMKLGMMNRASDEIDADTAELLVSEFKHIPKRVTAGDIEDKLKEEIVVDEKDLQPRPPVVTVMGHVDHGKTSLLDALRSANVVEGEAGGITQHIGAYQVTTPNNHKVTFIDTPGHAAFTAMRARGANVTDIVILVVAADDGIMPQTIEAINHAKMAKVPIIVAINKIDKPDANPKKVKEELLTHELVVEDFGGEVQAVEISAKQRTNLDKLLESVLVQAELLDLKASPTQKPVGTVIESRIDKGKGVVATLLVQRGTIRKGDIVIAGTASGRVKSIFDDKGKVIDEAGPSQPVEVLGFDEAPVAGETFTRTETDKEARDIVIYRKKFQLVEKQKAAGKNTLENMFKNAGAGVKELTIIVKGDVHGSVEAINGALEKIESEEVKVRVIHSGAGAISESDVQLANATNSIILGFNVRAEVNAKALAEQEKIDIRYFNIIYNLIDDVRLIVGGMLSPIIREVFLGNATIQQIFKMSKFGKVAGCKVTSGIIKRGSGVRLIRDNVVIHEGKLKTLKRFKDEVPEVREGFECGMAFENYEDIKEGDTLEAFETVEEKQTLA